MLNFFKDIDNPHDRKKNLLFFNNDFHALKSKYQLKPVCIDNKKYGPLRF